MTYITIFTTSQNAPALSQSTCLQYDQHHDDANVLADRKTDRRRGTTRRIPCNVWKSDFEKLSDELVREFGKGFSVDNLENMRRFYLAFQKSETVSPKFKLSWSHYIFLIRIDNIDERNFYEIEAVENRWTLREMKWQFDSGLYERLKNDCISIALAYRICSILGSVFEVRVTRNGEDFVNMIEYTL